MGNLTITTIRRRPKWGMVKILGFTRAELTFRRDADSHHWRSGLRHPIGSIVIRARSGLHRKTHSCDFGYRSYHAPRGKEPRGAWYLRWRCGLHYAHHRNPDPRRADVLRRTNGDPPMDSCVSGFTRSNL